MVAVRDEAAEAEIVVEVLELCEGGTDDGVVGGPTEGIGRGLASRSDPEVLLSPVDDCVKLFATFRRVLFRFKSGIVLVTDRK